MKIKWPEKTECVCLKIHNTDPIWGCECGAVAHNSAIDSCIAAEKESRMGVEEIHSIIYDFCEEKEIEIQPDWLCELAQAIHTALYGTEEPNA